MSHRPTTSRSDTDESVAELRGLAAARPAIAPWAESLADCLPNLFASTRGTATWSEPTVGQMARNQSTFAPLLRGCRVQLDGPTLRRALTALGEAIARRQARPVADEIAHRLAGDPGLMTRWLDQQLANGPEEAAAELRRRELDVPMASALLRLAVFPQLSALADSLVDRHAGRTWNRGACPSCGGWPLLGETRGLEQWRFLRCALCATSWQFPRMACAYCGRQDGRGLSFLQVGDKESRWRVVTCAACGGYLKTVTTLAELSPTQLLVQEVASMHLEVAVEDL